MKHAARRDRRSSPSGIALRDRLGQPWRRTLPALGVVVALGLLGLIDHRGWLLYEGGDWTRYNGWTFAVVRVTDGDTLWIDAPDGDQDVTRVRLWGIDTPEKAWHDPPRPGEPFAEEASALSTRLALNQPVTLWLQRHRVRGAYGRLLAYAELPDGTVLNEELLIRGLARFDDRWPHEHLERYRLLEEQARKDGVHLWGEAAAEETR